jgi:hypothetical protein
MAHARRALIIAPDDFPDEYDDYAAACRALKLEPNGHCYLVCLVTTAAGPRTVLTADLALLPDIYEAGTPDQASVPGTDRSKEAAFRAGAPSPFKDRPDRGLLQDPYPPETQGEPHVGLPGWGRHPEPSANPAPPPRRPEGEARGPALARVRFGVVRNPAATANKIAWPQRTNPLGRLVVELQTASVPADRKGTFDAVVRMSRGAHAVHDETGSLAEATAAYFAQWVDDQTTTVWATPGVLGRAEVSAVLDSCQQSLLDSVKSQLQDLATGGGAPVPAAGLAAGIGANLILAPEMRLEEGISSIIDICVLGIGVATGQPHLVVATARHLLDTVFDGALEHGVSEILNGLLNPTAPTAPGPGRPALPLQSAGEYPDQPVSPPDHEPDVIREGPTPAAEAQRQPDSSGQYPVTPPDSVIQPRPDGEDDTGVSRPSPGGI